MLTALKLPALESLAIFEFNLGETQLNSLQPDQLCCPQLTSLVYGFLSSQEVQASEGDRQLCSLLHLPRLKTLRLICSHDQATRMDLGLPASLEHLTVQQGFGADSVDLKWLLLEARRGIRSGVHLRSVACVNASPSCHPEGMPWGASSIAHYREIAAQLRGLSDLSVCGTATTLLSAISAVACSAPDLTRLILRSRRS